MKTEFLAAIAQLSAERHLPKEVILSALESALVSAYKKEAFLPEQSISVKIDSEGSVKVYLQKVVVKKVSNPYKEISEAGARKLRGSAQIGEIVEIESTPKNASRIAAQVARQVILQRLREAESHAIYEEFVGKEGELVAGMIQFIEPKQIYVGLGRTEAILPPSEQVSTERYYRGQRLKFYLLEMTRGAKGPQSPQIILSRSHPNLVRRLFELEIPEVSNGIIEIKGVAREAGYRSKVAVSSNQEGIEPVGSCLGPRSIRIQNIINELNAEKIDVIEWHANPQIFISNALGPAQVTRIEIEDEGKVANVIVPDRQLSLAIGKEGQNARLAAKLTGRRINIRSASAAEAERAREEAKAVAEEPALAEPAMPEIITTMEKEREIELVTVPEPPSEEKVVELVAAFQMPSKGLEEPAQIRFAEDILPSRSRMQGQDKEKAKVKGKRAKKKAVYLEDDEP